MKRGGEKQTITYQGREYRLASGHCSKCPLYSGGLNCRADGPRGFVDCGPAGVALRETLRSRIARWLYDPTPETDESHAATRCSTLNEVNARRPGGQS